MNSDFSEQIRKNRFTARRAMIRAGIGKYSNFGGIENAW